MEIIAETRKETGKKAKTLLKGRKLPAVVFGKGISSIPLTIDSLQFVKVFKEAGETTLVDLNIDGKSEKVLIKNVQYHPVSSNPIHVEFQKVNLKEKINANIPVEAINEEKNEFVKTGEAMVLVLLDEIEVEALPTDLPSAFVVDVSTVANIGDGITVAQLEYNREKVKILSADEDELVLKLERAEMEEEVVAETTEEELISKVEATKELTPEEKAAAEAKDKAAKEAKDKEKK